MGIWAGIKHALNSTLGTSEFQSLDKIILGQKGLKASQNLYAPVWSGNVSVDHDKSYDSGDIVEFNWSGSFILGIYGYRSSHTYRDVLVLKNGEEITKIFLPNGDTKEYTYSQPISIKKGDRISVRIPTGNPTIYLYKIDIFADVEDVSGVTIL